MGKNEGADAPNPAIRASDADRERVVEILRQHNVEGRITSEEFDERMSAAYEARTIGELTVLTHDLPVDLAAHTRHQAELARAASRKPLPAQLRAAVAGWASLAVLLTTIWLVSGAGSYWPAWPLGVLGALTVMRFIKAWGGQS
jgi:hypothetical protein